ncbi:GNAT family N-acetyltransferase [Pseudalkalibacillus hwajinpoensis]|uniref:GNAT family N-acetyltransferase n=1 Tax=Guptibacillus hwajinpoensis TaxID=208199 RepID=A0A4U1MHN8_9BACL|nr:GNAT family protein [Pseudalkalibacillus hwajinpoensis]TKD69946.1 GNAT family N-acetyltransferase [Pseudalkalibacillus hwajinpoensis]
MNYHFEMMNKEEVEKVISWKYEGIYAFYDMEADMEDLREFRDDAAENENYWSVYQKDLFVGFFNFNEQQIGQVEIGLGMNPKLVGQGYGLNFLMAGIQKAIALYQPSSLTMAVAEFNKRAIKVYQKAGFIPVKTFIQHTNGGTYPFISMKKEVDLHHSI